MLCVLGSGVYPKMHRYNVREPQRGPLADNSFDAASTSQLRSSGSHSRLSQASHAYDAAEPEVPETPVESEVPEAHEESDLDDPLESYPEGAFDTFLLYNYAEHTGKHV